MKTFLIILFLIPFSVIAQNRKYNFSSDYQVDKTYNGSMKEGHRNAIIYFSDPKLLTKEGMKFEELPIGYMIFKFEGLGQIKEDIIFLKRSNGTDIYAITNTQVGNDIIYVTNQIHKIGTKTYNYIIKWGKTKEDDLNGLQFFTTFHCNINK